MIFKDKMETVKHVNELFKLLHNIENLKLIDSQEESLYDLSLTIENGEFKSKISKDVKYKATIKKATIKNEALSHISYLLNQFID